MLAIKSDCEDNVIIFDTVLDGTTILDDDADIVFAIIEDMESDDFVVTTLYFGFVVRLMELSNENVVLLVSALTVVLGKLSCVSRVVLN